MTTTCKSCGAELPEVGGKGRPASYCSIACRRFSEFEIRRLSRTLDDLEKRAMWARDPNNVLCINREAEEAFIHAEIKRATDRLRALLRDGA